MILSIQEFFQNNWKYFLDGYLILIVISILVVFMLKNRKVIGPFLIYIIIIGLYILSRKIGLLISEKIYFYLTLVYPIILVICLAPDIRREIDAAQNRKKTTVLYSSSLKTKNAIVEASMYLSKKNIGALITLERQNSLDQYASKAIILDSEVSKELLINIFIPNTPLHDGAVIIRNNKISCAGAYFNLTSNQNKIDEDKTMGSRHRAALGISEVTDSITVCVSEETGDISLAYDGMMVPANDKDTLLGYLTDWLGEK